MYPPGCGEEEAGEEAGGSCWKLARKLLEAGEEEAGEEAGGSWRGGSWQVYQQKKPHLKDGAPGGGYPIVGLVLMSRVNGKPVVQQPVLKHCNP